MTAFESRGHNPVVAWIRRHPIIALLACFYPVGWAIAFIPFIARSAAGLEWDIAPFLMASTWIGMLLPMLVIVRLVDGPAGIEALRHRVLRVRASIGWYALALVAVPAVSVALAILTFGMPNVTPSAALQAVVVGLLLQTAVGCLTTNLWEEVGWMGFVQARLQSRHGVVLAAVITAALFMLQHVPLIVGQNLGLVVPIAFFIVAIPFRALVAWVYNRTDSLFVVGVLHAAGDAVVGGAITGVGLLPRLYDGYDVGFFGIFANVIIGLVVIVATRARLGIYPRAKAQLGGGGLRQAVYGNLICTC